MGWVTGIGRVSGALTVCEDTVCTGEGWKDGGYQWVICLGLRGTALAIALGGPTPVLCLGADKELRMLWRIQEFFRKLIPMVIVGAVALGGYNLYREGAFNRGVGYAVSHALGKLPYFGSRFRHYTRASSSPGRVAHSRGGRYQRQKKHRTYRQKARRSYRRHR